MQSFFKQRGMWLALVVVMLAVITFLQLSISLTFEMPALEKYVPVSATVVAVSTVLHLVLLAMLASLWLLRRKKALFNCIILSNSLFTLSLLAQTYALVRIISGISPRGVDALLMDVGMLAVVNILIFSIWYWVIDPPGVDDAPGADLPWAFMFPQRGTGLPHYESWKPHYADYLYLAFTNSFAFSPTDVLPLTKWAKMLMMLQSTISIIALTGIAGSAINILASGR